MASRNKSGKFISARKEKEDTIMSNGTEEIKPNDDGVWFSVAKGAPEYAQRKRMAITKALDNAKYANIFTPDMVRENVYHPDFPAVREVSKVALDQWLEATQKHGAVDGTAKVGNRKTRKGAPRRYHVGIPDAIADQVMAALNGFTNQGLTIETAYKPRAKNATEAASTPVENATSNAELFEQELVEA